ncbi:MAG: hypothetical protein K2Y27_28915 [Xanthobacteraceae bacterium]|nr:hypothetical protein [Xanthobacteraceae bacterium]
MTADGHGVMAINLVERLFAGIARQRIRRGTFNDVTELKTAIAEWRNYGDALPIAELRCGNSVIVSACVHSQHRPSGQARG